jgi:hypothetical protein
MEENRIPKRVLYMNLEPRPRNRSQNEVREDGRNFVGKSGSKNITERNGRSS